MYTVDMGRGDLVYTLLRYKIRATKGRQTQDCGVSTPGTLLSRHYSQQFKEILLPAPDANFVEAKANKYDKCRIPKKLKPCQQPFVPIELQAFEPGECWSVDIMTIRNIDYLVCVDRISQYLLLEKLLNITAKVCMEALKSWAYLLGIPTLIKSDG